MDRTIIAAIMLLLIAVTGCDDNRVYHIYDHTPITGWDKNDCIDFDVAPLQRTGQYVISLGLRLSDDYPFRNLNMIVRQTIYHGKDTMVKTLTDTITCDVVDRQGSMRGDGITLYQYSLPLRKMTYQHGDSIHVSVQHNMKREVLPGISDVGVQISKYNINR